MATGLDLGNLLVHLRADASQFNMIIGRAMRTMKRYAKFAAVAGVAQLTLSVREYAKFEEQMANVATMLDEQTMRYMPAYGDAIKQMAMEFGEGTATLSKGLYDILSASIPPAKALKVLAVSVKAAKAGMTTTAIAADAITTVLNSYGLAAEEAGRISDVLFAIIKRGKLTFAELAPNIGKVAAIASTAGLSFEEVGAAIATMTRAGLQADLATTSLRAVMNAFIKPGPEAAAFAMEKFGFELSSATLRSIGLTGVLEKLKGATAEQLAIIMPNIRGLAGFAAALKQAEKNADDLDLMLNSLGLTQEAYEKMTNTLMHAFNRFWQAIKITFVQIGSYLDPAVEKATSIMREWISVHQLEIGIVFVNTMKAMVQATQLFVNQIRQLNLYWTSFVIRIKQTHILLLEMLKLAPVVRGLGELLARKRGDLTLVDEIKKIKAEINLLEKKADDLALAFVKSSPGIDKFFDTLIANLEKVKEELEFEKNARDLQRAMQPAIDMQKKMADAIAKILKLREKAIKVAKDEASIQIPEITKGQGQIQEMLDALSQEYELLGLISEERERAIDFVKFQVLVEKELGKGTENALIVMEQYRAAWDKIIAGKMGWPAFTQQMRQWSDSATNIWQNFGEVAVNALDRIGNEFANFLMEGKANFTDFAKSVMKDLLAIAIRAQIVVPLAQALGFMSVPTGAGAGAGVTSGTVQSHALGAYGGGLQHGGSVEKTGWAVVHKGEKFSGVNNEVGIGKAPNIIINNNTGQRMEQERPALFDGENWVANIVIKKIASGGPLKDAIKEIR